VLRSAPGARPARRRPKFYYQKDEKARKRYFCEDHGIEFMQREKAGLLPRI